MENTDNSKRCPVYENCGGCQLQGLSYDEQLQLKQKRIDNLLSNFCSVEPIIGNEKHLNYRNKVQVTFGKDQNGHVICGTYVPSTHIIVPIKECQIADEKANGIIETVKKLVIKYNISIFDENSYRGCLRHVQVRCSSTGQYMVILVTGTSRIHKSELFINDLLEKHHEIKTIIQNINDRHTSMILGDKSYTLYGTGFIKDKLCGLDFSLSPTAFYQINKYQTEVLYNKALELAKLKGDEVAIDAYCGIGTISLLLSKKVKEVVGVEINKNAIKDANYNAKINKIDNVSFIADDAGRYMSRIEKQNNGKIDLVCMDPPRSGADIKFLKSLVGLGPKKIIYISCGPDSLKNNLDYLTAHGYQVDTIQPVDMFPYTEHVETIVILNKGQHFIKPIKHKSKSFNKNVITFVFILCAFLLGLFINIYPTFDNEPSIDTTPTETVIVEKEDKTGSEIEDEDVETDSDNVYDEVSLTINEKYTTGLEGKDITSPIYNLSFVCLDDGYDIYTPNRSGYRYGPSIIRNKDGSVDVWFASPGNNSTEWDYIRYRHMGADGRWSAEQIVLKPTADSNDHYSVCDPAVIYFGGYYYLAYTSTTSSNQLNNSLFVARSHDPEGPYEKWNGSGWGGNPEPIIYYDLQDDGWGAGEASFVVKDDTLYLYYSWLLLDESTTQVMCAPLDEDWPSKLEYKGKALTRTSGEDSFDVAYVETIDKFVAFTDVYKMTDYSGVGVYVSDDGINFKLTDVVRNNIKSFSHNLGISKGLDGHIDYNDELILGYAYSPDQETISWGCWATRFQTIKLTVYAKGE